MQAPSALTDKVRRLASWLAVILGCLSLATAFFSPVAAVVNATLLFVLAFAVRKGGSGPALAYTDFPIAWSYTFESALPLVGGPTVW